MPRFRTSARTVDMLGRQQIAGIPTAISELFKNAYDAYATRVEADYYRPDRLLVIRDDGLGMTLEDVIGRWLVLGTDSKVGGGGDLAAAATKKMQPRIPTGEKGIGRLAIAAIGPQVLLVSRARRDDGLTPTVAAFVNWSLFALPSISIDEIEVPVHEYADGRLPTAEDLITMVDAVRDNLEEIRPQAGKSAFFEIARQLDQATFDVAALQERFDYAKLTESATGTQFYIQPTDSMLEIALDAKPDKRRIGDLQKTLMGFTNTMMPDHKDPAIRTEFRDHKSHDFFDAVIGAEEFFTPNEFREADHRIRGKFDEFGQFAGMVSVYGNDPEYHIIPWPEARGHRTACGTFSIDFAYIQGAARESRIPRERWNKLIEKLDRLGGLYIYRNGIRILPYGNTDYDFLHIEERRNLGAGYYFFSYRRMFGAIELPPDSADRLSEKAGREGFRENRAYRQFRAILENFLIQLAADYFRDEAVRGSEYRRTKTDLDNKVKALESQAKRSREMRQALEAALLECATSLHSSEPERRVGEILRKLELDVQSSRWLVDADSRLRSILESERQTKSALTDLRKGYRIARPRGLALTKKLRSDLTAYKAEFDKLDKELFRPAQDKIDAVITSSASDLKAVQRRRFDAAAEDAGQAARKAVNARSRSSREHLRETNELVSSAVRQTLEDLESAFNEIAQQVQRTVLSDLTDEEIVRLRLHFESEFDTLATVKEDQLAAISEQLKAITVTPDDSGQIITYLDTAGAIEEEWLAIQERIDADLELTQLGMAIEIIDHEFQATIRSVRNNLRRLKAWADVNENLSDVYNGIRVSFEHLDSYLTLFTPLHRRLYRSQIEIKGSDVSKFLKDLFGGRLERHTVEFQPTAAFRSQKFRGYPSTFYPVFVNLVDNAIYWLQDHAHPRIIRLDALGETMVVADNGPGIPPADREAIFELGFTRKPGGRGLGLYISRDVLSSVGFNLVVGESDDGVWTLFYLCPKEQKA